MGLNDSDVDRLINRLRSGNVYERYEAASQLRGSGDKQAAHALASAATSDERWEVRREAVKSLGEAGDQSTYETLIQSTDDASPFVRMAAICSLGQLKDRRAIPAGK